MPRSRSPPASWTTADRRPIVAMVPLSWYRNGSVACWPSSLTICAAACRPICRAGWASCGVGSSGFTAMSPAAKIRSWPCTRRSGPTAMRPVLPCGRPQPATPGPAATPAAQTVMSLGRSSLWASRTWFAVTSSMRVSSRTSTPRSSSWALAYSCSFGWNGPSRCGAISTSRTCTRAGSTSGKVEASTVRRSSASVPASSTPVAPPPTTVTFRSPWSTLSRSKPAIRWSRSAMASVLV